MRALTLTQPWCGLVASGIKLIENRPRRVIKRSDFGTTFALHASRESHRETYARIVTIAPWLSVTVVNDDHRCWYKLSAIVSAVIAVAEVVRDVTEEEVGTGALRDLPDQRRWYMPPQIGYVLTNVRTLREPVGCKGKLGFWTLPDDVERAVRNQLAEATP